MLKNLGICKFDTQINYSPIKLHITYFEKIRENHIKILNKYSELRKIRLKSKNFYYNYIEGGTIVIVPPSDCVIQTKPLRLA